MVGEGQERRHWSKYHFSEVLSKAFEFLSERDPYLPLGDPSKSPMEMVRVDLRTSAAERETYFTWIMQSNPDTLTTFDIRFDIIGHVICL